MGSIPIARSKLSRLGVDLGATWLRACLNEPAHPLRQARWDAVNWREAPKVLRGWLHRLCVKRVDELTLGGTRLGGAKERAELAALLKPLARRVRVLPDFELAHQTAFGRGPGVVLVASTGSVAFARDAKGKTQRAGGLGPWFGDEGSGFWIGREAVLDESLRIALRLPKPLDLAHAADPVRATAALAPRVLNAAGRNPRARKIRRRAAAHLAALARAVGMRKGLPRPIPLALHGSLFRNKEFRAAVIQRLGKDWSLTRKSGRPEQAAVFVK